VRDHETPVNGDAKLNACGVAGNAVEQYIDPSYDDYGPKKRQRVSRWIEEPPVLATTLGEEPAQIVEADFSKARRVDRPLPGRVEGRSADRLALRTDEDQSVGRRRRLIYEVSLHSGEDVWRDQRRARDCRVALGLRIMASRASEYHEQDPVEVVVHRDSALVALGRLPEADRELLCLVAWADLSAEEAARVLSCSKPTLLVRLHRARRRFMAALADEDDVPSRVRRSKTVAQEVPPLDRFYRGRPSDEQGSNDREAGCRSPGRDPARRASGDVCSNRRNPADADRPSTAGAAGSTWNADRDPRGSTEWAVR